MIKSIGMEKYNIINTDTKYFNKVFNSNSGDFKVLGIWGRDKRGQLLYVCEFLNTGFQTLSSSGNLTKGRLKDLYVPTICGVGYIGDCDSLKIVEENPIYRTWKHMLNRCYNEDLFVKNSTYKDCKVCEEWFNFGTYSRESKQILGYEDMIKNNNIKFHIDKDILEHGNKIYCINKCCYVPEKINVFFVNKQKTKSIFPIGLSPRADGGIRSTIFFNNKQVHLGSFKNTKDGIYEAQKSYWNKKLEIANIYLNMYPFLDKKICEAVIKKVILQAKEEGIALR